MTTPTMGRQLDRSSSMTFATPMTSNKFAKKIDFEEPENSSNVQMISLKDVQSKLDQLFSLHEAQQVEITVSF
jgi:hypothetical protein